jgi:hypothetical protein
VSGNRSGSQQFGKPCREDLANWLDGFLAFVLQKSKGKIDGVVLPWVLHAQGSSSWGRSRRGLDHGRRAGRPSREHRRAPAAMACAQTQGERAVDGSCVEVWTPGKKDKA